MLHKLSENTKQNMAHKDCMQQFDALSALLFMLFCTILFCLAIFHFLQQFNVILSCCNVYVEQIQEEIV